MGRSPACFTIPSFLRPAVTLFCLGFSQAQPGNLRHQWTVTVVEHDSGNLDDSTLVMDTASTTGFDDGLDVLCSADSGGAEACLLIDSTSYLTSYIPSNGDSAIHWAVS